jgi:hypothetical protein
MTDSLQKPPDYHVPGCGSEGRKSRRVLRFDGGLCDLRLDPFFQEDPALIESTSGNKLKVATSG